MLNGGWITRELREQVQHEPGEGEQQRRDQKRRAVARGQLDHRASLPVFRTGLSFQRVNLLLKIAWTIALIAERIGKAPAVAKCRRLVPDPPRAVADDEAKGREENHRQGRELEGMPPRRIDNDV